MGKQSGVARGTVVVALLLAVTMVYADSSWAKDAKPGVERWPIKTSLPAGAEVTKPIEVPLLRLLILAEPPGVTHNDRRYQAARIPEFSNSLDLKEGDIISTSGWLHLVAAEDDGDYHIQISASPTDGNNCLIVEVPRDEAQFVTSPQVRQLSGAVREFVRTQVLQGQEPPVGGVSVVSPAVYVKVTGQLFYDDAHVGDPPRGKKGMKAKTLWEIHPITKIDAATPAKP
jgi:hypothetical protein